MPDTLRMSLSRHRNYRAWIAVLIAVDAFLLWANLWVWMPDPSSPTSETPVQTERPEWEGDLFTDTQEEEPQMPHVPVPEPVPEEEATRSPGEPTPEQSPTPSVQPEPSERPTPQPTPEPIPEPTPEPTEEPSPQPTESSP